MPRTKITHDNPRPYRAEQHLLRQLDKKDVDSDNWPCLLLKDAIVYSRNGQEMANLLHCATEGPFTIRGILSIPKKHKNIQLITCNTEPIQINNCVEFSFDGEPNLWARGLAGWFELKPEEAYKSIYERMLQAIDLYNFLVDMHDTREKPKNCYTKDIQTILAKYMDMHEYDHLPPVNDEREFTNFLLSHATSLISQMCREHCFVDWPRTYIYNWLIERRPEIHANYLKQTISNRNTKEAKSPTTTKPPITSASSNHPWSSTNMDSTNDDPFYIPKTKTPLSKQIVTPPKQLTTTPHSKPDINTPTTTPHNSHAGKGRGKKVLARTPAKRSHSEMENQETNDNPLETPKSHSHDSAESQESSEEAAESEESSKEEEEAEAEHTPSTNTNPTSHRSKTHKALLANIDSHITEEERMLLLVQEMGKSRNLPVANLLARVKGYGEEVRKQEMQIINGKMAPVPIRRKLLR